MTDPSDAFDALTLPPAPLEPRPAAMADLRARVHRRLGFAPPEGAVPMRKTVGLEHEVNGTPDGAAVLLMHAGTATAYLPLMQESALADRYQLVRYHRRGYAGSDGFDGAASIRRHVDDARALLDHLGIDRAHVVGHSGSGVIALQLALDAPDRVRSLVLQEPALHDLVPGLGPVTREAIGIAVGRYRAGDVRGAIEMWMRNISQTWRTDLARTVPGGPQQTHEDATAFFADVEAVLDWHVDGSRLEGLVIPVLHVLSSANPGAREVRRRFEEIVVQTESVVIPHTTHMLHTDQPGLVAVELAAFFTRHADQP